MRGGEAKRKTAALAIFVKTPGHSPIKTRLGAAIGEEGALAFHRIAARAVMEIAHAARDSAGDPQPYWAVAEGEALDNPIWRDAPVLWQGEGGLGERLHRVYAELLARHDRVLLLGADAPQLTPDLVRAALLAASAPRTPFALGPAFDGGFWLFGGRAPVAREIWCNIVYSRPDTCTRLRAALAPSGVAELPMLSDVDCAPDLALLAKALDRLPHPLPAQRELRTWLRDSMPLACQQSDV